MPKLEHTYTVYSIFEEYVRILTYSILAYTYARALHNASDIIIPQRFTGVILDT